MNSRTSTGVPFHQSRWPGVYRIVMGEADEEGNFTTNDIFSGQYTLTITNIGNLAVGGLVMDSDIFDGGSIID